MKIQSLPRAVRVAFMVLGLTSLGLTTSATEPYPTVRQFQMECINKKLLLAVLDTSETKALVQIGDKIQFGDRDVQRLYFAKLYSVKPSPELAKRLLELMPQGELESIQFYVYTYLRDQRAVGPSWISEKQSKQAGDLYFDYYNQVRKLLPNYPTYLDRYLVMVHWANADIAEAVANWEPALRKAFGSRYDEEKTRVWNVLDEEKGAASTTPN